VTGENGGAQTDSNDWRVTVRLTEAGAAQQAMTALSAHQVEDEVHQRLGGRVVLGSDGAHGLFLYTHTQDAAAAATASVRELLGSSGQTAEFTVERWHPIEEEWEPADVPEPADPGAIQAERARLDAEETSQSLAWGHALYEVKVELPAHREAVALAERLAAEGYQVVRRWRFLVVGANNADQAEDFRAAIAQLAPADAVITAAAVGSTPFTAFELAAESGL
jgi:hypothetical protein